MKKAYRSVPMAFACPLPLEEWLVNEAHRQDITRSCLVNRIILEASGLDIELRRQGRPRWEGEKW